MLRVKRLVCYILYYFFARHLPVSYKPYGFGARKIRYWVCRGMLGRCGKNVNIEHGDDIGSDRHIEIGDNSGIGVNCRVGKAKIGDNVMMGPDVVFISSNHNFADPDKRLQGQGYTEDTIVEVGDNVWIGTRVLVLPGCKKIGKNAIIGGGAVITKDVPDYAVVGGNPAKVIKMRK